LAQEIGDRRNRSISPDFESSAKKMLTPKPSKIAMVARYPGMR
jgi:hypothetical protein